MTAPDRIPCLNPRCRRTAPRSRHPEASEIVCGKCWRNLPRPLRDRYRELTRRSRRTTRAVERRERQNRPVSAATLWYLRRAMEKRCDENWSRIRAYFLAPERPVGIEGFLQEMGLS